MSNDLDRQLIDNGYERSPYGNHSFKWADGHTAVYVEPHETGGYTVSTYRPYGTRVFVVNGLNFHTAAACALSESAAAHVTT